MVFLYRIYFSIFLYTHLIMFLGIKLHIWCIYAHHLEGQGWTFPTVNRVYYSLVFTPQINFQLL